MFIEPADAEEPASSQSINLFRRGQTVFPGGVTRATVDKEPHPVYMARGEGAYLVDVDDARLLDLNNNFTTLLHGHGFEPVLAAVGSLLSTGTCFSNPTRHEIALAELLTSRIPGAERIRFVSTGTEAVMFAIKAARAFTGRSAIARFAGAYHGAYDWAEAGQNGFEADPNGRRKARLGYQGAPSAVANDVLVLDFNDADALEEALNVNAKRFAAVLIDPMPSRAGLIEPAPEFIDRLMTVADRHGILIIADEVLNLRQSFAGASARYSLKPDLLVAGKIIGGGFPIGAIGGSAKVMSVFGGDKRSPMVSQGGTFSANPVSMVAGRVAMEAATTAVFERLEQQGNRLRAQLTMIARKHNAPFSVTGAASLLRLHPKSEPPRSFAAAVQAPEEVARMRVLCRFLRQEGILMPHDAAACLSTPMNETDLDHVADAFDRFLTQQSFSSQEAQP
ncbi:aspartate aminotransferase family protein [Pararhizobium arenae]|uniref:aspartate aminotransferase family protein n=1 Tax=Pararhizobium arenae TaxID=1856850 RepID=UPI00094B7375|nr:aspartate aminotransferase family protein [Pararhizobium arenae]